MNVCVIPVYNRPEYLKICLDYIIQAEDSDKLAYIFACDHGYSAKNMDVIKEFPYKKYVVKPASIRYGIGKQSFNVLNGLFASLSLQPDLIYYIEDDVFITNDFFVFTEKIHSQNKDLFCSILSKNVNGKETVTDDMNAYYIKHSNEYQGIGSCFNASQFVKYVRPHFVSEYFKSPQNYVYRYFANSALSREFAEQDGLIRRIIEQNNLPVAFSHVPRCFHAGFYGYHRSPNININSMTFEQRIEAIKSISFDVNELSKIAQNCDLVNDSLPINMETSHSDCYIWNVE